MAAKKRKQTIAWAIEERGHIWVAFIRYTRTEAMLAWCNEVNAGRWSWDEWHKTRPDLRAVKVQFPQEETDTTPTPAPLRRKRKKAPDA